MIGLCNVCKKIGLDAKWPQLPISVRYARCDHCNLYCKSGKLNAFKATQGDLKRALDENPKSQLLALGTLNDGRTGDPLYCVSYWWRPFSNTTKQGVGNWKMTEIYMHAKDEGEARFAFLISHQEIQVDIIGIAPVIGWHVVNEEEGKLAAS